MDMHPFDFEVPEEVRVPMYINAHTVTHSDREFFIDLAATIPYGKSKTEGRNRVLFRFCISRAHLQEFILNLQNQLREFDGKGKPPEPPPLGKDRF